MISPLAYVEPGAQLGENVEVHPFAFIQKDVVIGDNCIIYPRASVLNGTRMGKNNTVYSNAVIGAEPQSFHFKKGMPVYVTIGDDNDIRENVVIAGGFLGEKGTVIGNRNHLMDRVHICHDVVVENGTVLGINSILSGSSYIYGHAILSNSVVVQDSVRVGRFSLVQSNMGVRRDVPPYTIIGGNPARYQGINAHLLEKEGRDERTLRHIGNAYRLIYKGNFSLEDAVLQIKEQIPEGPQVNRIIEFVETSKHGIVRDQKNDY